MPELPEVETTIRGLRPVIGSTIINIKINTPKLRFIIPKKISLLTKVQITDIIRRGKFIIFLLSNDHTIILHLGMSGRLRLFRDNQFEQKKHDHFFLRTNQDHLIVFNDSRRFGFIDYGKTKDMFEKKYILKLGREALGKNLNGKYLLSKISNTSVPIKQILLNQQIIAGIGNIYVCEILFNARISPLIHGKKLNLKECEKIIISTQIILKKAIKHGGSTLRDYVSVDGTLGNFQSNFQVYNQEGKTILGKKIKKIVQYGRSTYYCPGLQKIK